MTRAPKYYLLESDGIYLVDGPGINDSVLRNEYANQTAIKSILTSSSTFTMLLIIDAN